MFIIRFNGICLRPKIPRPNGNCAIQLKYIDDATKAASINLKESLITDPEQRPAPLNYHESSGKILNPEENVLQVELNCFFKETMENNFVINKKKTTVMLCNNSKKFLFPPEFTIGESEILSVKREMKILGVMLQDDLKWEAHVKQMTTKASKKIWLLRRMKQLGVDEATITSYWKMEGLVHLEFCVPLWAGGITGGQAQQLSRVQRRAAPWPPSRAIAGRTTPPPASASASSMIWRKDAQSFAKPLPRGQQLNPDTKIFSKDLKIPE